MSTSRPTVEDCTGLRIATEQRVLDALLDLCKLTRIDMARVEVYLVVSAGEDGEPRRTPRAVRIEMAV